MSQARPRPPYATAFASMISALLLGCAAHAAAQISLSTAVNLALQNSPRVKIAQVDLDRAKAVLGEVKSAYVPAASANAGVGRASGAPLSPPVIFSVSAQSLIFSFSQPDYIRAAHSGLYSAQLALDVARTDVSEDTINTYLALDNVDRRRQIEAEEAGFAAKLVEIVANRYAAGVDPHIELTRAKRTEAQIKLQLLQLTDEVANNREHLALLTALPATGWKTVPESVPDIELPSQITPGASDDPTRLQGISAAFATARARQYTARGDQRALHTPQFSFSANFSQLSDAFSSYDTYYPGFHQDLNAPFTVHSFRSLSAGVQLSLPILDMVRRARAKESQADATRSLLDAENQRATFLESRVRLRHSAQELAARAEVANLDHDLAQDELDAVLIRLRAIDGAVAGPQSSPKDEQNARLAERQRTFDMLVAELQLHQAEVSLMRQEGSLANYLAATIPGAAGTPAPATRSITPVLPTTLGTSPGAGSVPSNVPTTGTTPSALPSAPVSAPSPTAPSPSSPGSAPPAAPAGSPHW